MLDGGEGQGDEVAEIGRKVQRRDEECAEGQRERDVALGRADFAGGEGDVVPGIGRKQRTDLGDAQGDEESEGGGGAQAGGDGRDAAGRPEVAEVGSDGIGVAREEQSDDDEREEGKGLSGGEDVLDELADLKAAGVDERQQDNDEDGGDLLGREAHGVVGREVDRRNNPGGRRDRRRQHAEVAGERDRHRRDGAGLDDQE